MTCREVMTANPSSCVPGDSVAVAAQIMKREDVGPVMVVSDHTDRRLVGIVTDRDLAIKVVAEGRDPHSTRLDEVMSSNPITCNENDDVSEAMRMMADYQVRRIPIVDENHRLIGVIAQADVARIGDEEEVGDMVEEISQPYGAGEWRGGDREYSTAASSTGSRASTGLSAFAACSIGFGLGAGLMYLLDPNSGRRRRAVVRDKTTSYVNTSSEYLDKKRRHLSNKAQGLAAETRSALRNVSERVGMGQTAGTGSQTSRTPTGGSTPVGM
jgi:CBS domain-containing protein